MPHLRRVEFYRNRGWTFTALTCWLVCAASLCSVMAVMFSTQGSTPIGKPPLGSKRLLAGSWLKSSQNFRAQIDLQLGEKRVDINWYYAPPVESLAITDRPVFLGQTVAVAYWPTTADVVAADKFVVAGRERNGSTRIEIWTIEEPTVKTIPKGDSSKSYLLTARPIKDVTLLYNAAVVGKDTARGIIALRGGSSLVLVQFHDSRDLYTLEWAAAPYPLTLLSSASSYPALATEYDIYHGGNHSIAGYVYLMGSIADPSIGPAYMLRDSNRDGIIDSQGPVSQSQWDELQLGRRDLYIEYNGLPWPE